VQRIGAAGPGPAPGGVFACRGVLVARP